MNSLNLVFMFINLQSFIFTNCYHLLVFKLYHDQNFMPLIFFPLEKINVFTVAPKYLLFCSFYRIIYLFTKFHIKVHFSQFISVYYYQFLSHIFLTIKYIAFIIFHIFRKTFINGLKDLHITLHELNGNPL